MFKSRSNEKKINIYLIYNVHCNSKKKNQAIFIVKILAKVVMDFPFMEIDVF